MRNIWVGPTAGSWRAITTRKSSVKASTGPAHTPPARGQRYKTEAVLPTPRAAFCCGAIALCCTAGRPTRAEAKPAAASQAKGGRHGCQSPTTRCMPRPVDFIDGVFFSPTEAYLTLAGSTGRTPYTSDYTRTEIYYHSIQSQREDWLTVLGYLWRWDTEWFWCSRAFMAQHRWARRLTGPRFLRRDVYWRIKALEDRHHGKATIDMLLGRPDREKVIQGVELPPREVPRTPLTGAWPPWRSRRGRSSKLRASS